MRFIPQKLYLQIIIFLIAANAHAQEPWPSPEVEQMYRHAREYMAAGNLKDAAITFKQAIILAPGNMILYKELGNAQYLSGNFSDAEQTLSSLQNSKDADEECFQLLAASQAAQKKMKDAKKTLHAGLSRFAASGLLYNETGNEYTLKNDHKAALNAWLDGIENAPGYPQNYYSAALVYLNSEKVFWGLMYGELFLVMKPVSPSNRNDTVQDEQLKKMLFAGYKKMFDNIGSSEAPQYGRVKAGQDATTFEAAVLKIYTTLTPVVSDGVTAENLTMVRTRFLMDWFSEYGSKYPFSLFSYQDELARNGKFDIYNEWIFGKAENEVQYDAWNNFHEGDIVRFLQWEAKHIVVPKAGAFYNERDMKGLFDKKKK
jgi:tetratricopeptide (TPR) repeat protein